VQPENPAEFGGRVYEMMGMALAGRRSAREEQSGSAAPEVTTEESSPKESEPQSEVVEASEVITENDPWK
jgi:heat shock protein beta